MGGEERVESPERERQAAPERPQRQRRTASSQAVVLRASKGRGCCLPVRGYTGAPPTPPTGTEDNISPAACGRLISSDCCRSSLSRRTDVPEINISDSSSLRGQTGLEADRLVLCLAPGIEAEGRRPRQRARVTRARPARAAPDHTNNCCTFCFRTGSSTQTAHSSIVCRTVVANTPCCASRSSTRGRSPSTRAKAISARSRIS